MEQRLVIAAIAESVEALLVGIEALRTSIGTIGPTFMPLTIEPPTPADLRVELQRGPVSNVAKWPASAMSDCAA